MLVHTIESAICEGVPMCDCENIFPFSTMIAEAQKHPSGGLEDTPHNASPGRILHRAYSL